MDQIFKLIYFGGFSYGEIMKMPIYQRNHFYSLLAQQKNEEAEAYKKTDRKR
jgi:hypothetical protein